MNYPATRDTKAFVKKIQDVINYIHAQIYITQAYYEEQTNRHWRPAYYYYVR